MTKRVVPYVDDEDVAQATAERRIEELVRDLVRLEEAWRGARRDLTALSQAHKSYRQWLGIGHVLHALALDVHSNGDLPLVPHLSAVAAGLLTASASPTDGLTVKQVNCFLRFARDEIANAMGGNAETGALIALVLGKCKLVTPPIFPDDSETMRKMQRAVETMLRSFRKKRARNSQEKAESLIMAALRSAGWPSDPFATDRMRKTRALKAKRVKGGRKM